MVKLLGFVNYLIYLYTIVVFASVIMSWLINFGVINGYNPTVRAIYEALQSITEPLLRPIRNALPNFGGIDFSPVVLLLACFFMQSVVIGNLIDMLAYGNSYSPSGVGGPR